MAAPKLTKAKILESIRQMMSTDIDENMAVVLYEGDADRMFAEHYLNDENIFFFESPSGKTGLYELLRDTADKPYADRIIAIRDRDYSDPAEYPPRLFAYDDCALEVMLLHHKEVRGKGADIYQGEDKEDFPLRPMRRIAPFSVLRMLNEQRRMNLNLKKGVMAGRNGQAGPEMELSFRCLNVSGFLEECTAKAAEFGDDDLWAITNGHDICALLGAFSKMGANTLGEAGYRAFLFTTYRVSDFRSSALFRSLRQYGEEHGLSIVRVEENGEVS